MVRQFYQGVKLKMNKDVLSALNNIIAMMKEMTPETYETFEPEHLAAAREYIQSDYYSDESFKIIGDLIGEEDLVKMEEVSICDHQTKDNHLSSSWITSTEMILLSWAA